MLLSSREISGYLKRCSAASLILLLSLSLVGCGGGSSSSGVGQPHATPYAGVYDAFVIGIFESLLVICSVNLINGVRLLV